ncbi:MAG: hypothetical protein ABII02_02165 [Candidatus Magasanikbacteria bacterium]
MHTIWSKTTKHFSSLAKFFSLSRYSQRERILLVCVLIVGVFLVANQAHAVLAGIFNELIQIIVWILLALSKIFIALSIFALKLFIEIAKYNNYINVHTVVLGWAMVRDVANMFFVMILLVIAFATILGIEQYEWKKTLVKLVLAAIFINFSKLICGIIIDFAHVFTITFLSAVSATAGGNLIQMFGIERIHKLTGVGKGSSGLNSELFVAAVIAFFFAGLTFLSMAAYMVVLIARVVVLWVLIILSPLAFIMQVLPATQQYAKEWWSKFIKQVIVAPIMVFFLWLAFATLGNGKFATNTKEAGGMGLNMALVDGGDIPKLSISDATSWENMANFLIGAAFLWVGIGVVQKLGVVGGEMIPGMIGFGKRVATIATGYAAGRKLAGATGEKGLELGGSALKGIGRVATIKPRAWGKAVKTAAQAQLQSYGRRDSKQLGAFGKVAGYFVRGSIQRQKRQGKLEGALKQEEELGFARNEAKMSGLGFYQFKEKAADGTDVSAGLPEGKDVESVRDRYLGGVMAAEKERKSNKTEEWSEVGRLQTLSDERVKGGGVQTGKGSLAKQINDNKAKTMEIKGKIKVLTESLSSEADELRIQKENEYDIAKATAADYRKKGDNPMAEATMRAFEDKWAKKQEEAHNVTSYTDKLKTEKDLTTEMAKLLKKKDTGTFTEKDEKNYKLMGQQKIASITQANNLDLETARDTRARGLETLDIDEEVNEDNAVRLELSRILARKVDSSDEDMEKAVKEVQAMYDSPEMYQASMRRLLGSYKKAAISGDNSAIGIVGEYVDKDNNLTLAWGQGKHYGADGTKTKLWDTKQNPDNEKHKSLQERGADSFSADRSEGTLDYYTTRRNPTNVDNASTIATADNTGVQAMKNMFSAKDSRSLSLVPPSFWKSLNTRDVSKYSDDQREQLRAGFLAAREGLKENARRDFDKYLKDYMGALKVTVPDSSPSAPSGGGSTSDDGGALPADNLYVYNKRDF